ncbi:Transmembrane protein 19 [Armadillidium vulgare]|nr:Transmembrane protein 19 [Armadillidium vulgare]
MCVGFPTALSLWIGNVLLASLFRELIVFVCFSITGYFVGFIITLSNFIFLSCLATFFVTSSKLTKFRSHMKQKLEEHFVEGGKRNWIQVLSNGIVGSIIAFIYILDCGAQEQILDVRNKYRCTLIAYSFLGAFACSNGDTWASEVGPVMMYGANPFLITTFKRVPKGTNGGVSIAGLLASFMGGANSGIVVLCHSSSDGVIKRNA